MDEDGCCLLQPAALRSRSAARPRSTESVCAHMCVCISDVFLYPLVHMYAYVCVWEGEGGGKGGVEGGGVLLSLYMVLDR